jgi:Ca-activated chloride channel family protein
VPAALFLIALTVLVAALARPVLPWPAARGWPVALVIDVSRSMEETDIPPSRIAAARTAAAEFVRGLPRSTPAALVTFGNYATVVVPLTTDRPRLLDGIANLTTQLRTQLGNGLQEGVRVVTGEGPPPAPGTTPRAVVVLLSDGRASDGVPPLEAAQVAHARGVRVYTVGMGTFGNPAQFRSGYWGVLDEPTLRAIAQDTGGQYFHAASAGRLQSVYRELARVVGWTRSPQEVSAPVSAAAFLFLVGAVALRFRAFPLA